MGRHRAWPEQAGVGHLISGQTAPFHTGYRTPSEEPGESDVGGSNLRVDVDLSGACPLPVPCASISAISDHSGDALLRLATDSELGPRHSAQS